MIELIYLSFFFNSDWTKGRIFFFFTGVYYLFVYCWDWITCTGDISASV